MNPWPVGCKYYREVGSTSTMLLLNAEVECLSLCTFLHHVWRLRSHRDDLKISICDLSVNNTLQSLIAHCLYWQFSLLSPCICNDNSGFRNLWCSGFSPLPFTISPRLTVKINCVLTHWRHDFLHCFSAGKTHILSVLMFCLSSIVNRCFHAIFTAMHKSLHRNTFQITLTGVRVPLLRMFLFSFG